MSEQLTDALNERNAQLIALTEEVREELEESDAENPILFAEQGPNRFSVMSLFFEDVVGGNNDGVNITEDLDTQDIVVKYFTDTDEIELTEGAVYDWAIDFYKNN